MVDLIFTALRTQAAALVLCGRGCQAIGLNPFLLLAVCTSIGFEDVFTVERCEYQPYNQWLTRYFSKCCGLLPPSWTIDNRQGVGNLDDFSEVCPLVHHSPLFQGKSI
jgi:hypothetical protein